MPLSSLEIANMNGAYMQQGIAQMQNAQMIGQIAPATQGIGQGVMGRAMNMGSAVGAPMMSGALALAGLDPVSMGLRGAMTGFRAGGMMGGAVGGIGAASAVALPMMAAGYIGNQMMQGAQQQQQLNTAMQQSFRFRNQYGGTGFTGGQLTTIGESLRSMSGQTGPGGEMVGFGELGRLAANMGRMGMGQGVRDAKEFSDKFKQMMTSLKDIAHNMSTSLEEAQKLMSDMRGSGIFNNRMASQASGAIRSTAVAGGLATSEVTGMMSVGSQISRMVGGLGRQGAVAGIQTIGQVGSALQTGVLSEEDIYNTTGQTGAEGRRAYATNMMQQSAQFLKGGLGRRFLASVAGKNGTIDEGSLDEYMAGGVSTGRTMQMAGQNLAKVGRANFIRNEGRLRGGAMQALGGLAPALVMKNWLESRGMDVNEDSDRSMLFIQRRLGMGRDEAEQMVRMARELPRLMEHRRESIREDEIGKKSAFMRSHSGLEGVKRKLEKARSDVQNDLQQAGAEFMQSGADLIESFVNRLTGTYVTEHRRDVERSFKTASGTGASASQAARQLLGGGDLGQSSYVRGLSAAGRNRMATGGMGGLEAFRKFDAERFERAGFKITATTEDDFRRQMEQVRDVGRAAQTGLASRGSEFQLGQSMRSDIRQLMATGRISGQGTDLTRSFMNEARVLARQPGNEQMKKLVEKLEATTSEAERTRMVTGVMGGAGGDMGVGERYMPPELMGIAGRGYSATEMQMARGASYFGRKVTSGTMAARTMGTMLEKGLQGYASIATLGGYNLVKKAAGFDPLRALGIGALGEQTSQERALGDVLGGEEYRRTAEAALGEDKDVAAATRERVERETFKLKGQLDLADSEGRTKDPAQLAKMNANLGIMAAMDLDKLGPNPDPEKKQELLRRYRGLDPNIKDWSDLENRVGGAIGAASDTIMQRRRQMFNQVAESATRSVDELRSIGVIKDGAIDKEFLSKFDVKSGNIKGEGAAARFLKASIQATGMEEKLSGLNDVEREAYMAGIVSQRQDASKQLEDMTVAEKRKMAEGLRGTDLGRQLLASAATQEQIQKGGKGKGGVKAAVSALGAKVDDKTLAALAKGDEGAVLQLAKQLGVETPDKALRQDLMSMVTDAASGKAGSAAGKLSSITSREDVREAQKKKALDKQKDEDPLAAESAKALGVIAKAVSTTLKVQVTNTGDFKDGVGGKAEDGGHNPGNPCLSGDTLVHTIDGMVPIQELAGKTVQVLAYGGTYQMGTFRSYGRHELFDVVLDDGQVIRATATHRWPYQSDDGLAWTTTPGVSGKRLYRMVGGHSDPTVVEVRTTGVVEEVFCGRVPETSSFTIADGILTGNK